MSERSDVEDGHGRNGPPVTRRRVVLDQMPRSAVLTMQAARWVLTALLGLDAHPGWVQVRVGDWVHSMVCAGSGAGFGAELPTGACSP